MSIHGFLALIASEKKLAANLMKISYTHWVIYFLLLQKSLFLSTIWLFYISVYMSDIVNDTYVDFTDFTVEIKPVTNSPNSFYKSLKY